MSKSTKQNANDKVAESRLGQATYSESATPNVSLFTKTGNSDAKGRVVLGPQFANKTFRLTEQPDGNLLLEPVVVVHERELWFYRNKGVQAMVQEGIRQSRAGETVDRGSFAKHAGLDLEDENDA